MLGMRLLGQLKRYYVSISGQVKDLNENMTLPRPAFTQVKGDYISIESRIIKLYSKEEKEKRIEVKRGKIEV